MNNTDAIYLDLFFNEADKRPQVLQYFMERPYGTLNLLKDSVKTEVNYRIPMRSAWIISHLGQNHPTFLQSYYNELIDTFLISTDSSVLRSLGKAINHLKIKEYRLGEVFDFCYAQASDLNQAVAARVNCLYILWGISKHIPDLKPEVKQLAELLADNSKEVSLKSILRKIINSK